MLTLLALDKAGVEIVCLVPDKPQHHVVNYLNGVEEFWMKIKNLQAEKRHDGSLASFRKGSI